MNTPDLHTLWKNQPTEEIDMNAAITERSDKFQNQLANLRTREHVAGIVVLVVFTVYFSSSATRSFKRVVCSPSWLICFRCGIWNNACAAREVRCRGWANRASRFTAKA